MDTGYKKCKEKLVGKVSGMWNPLFNTDFIIKMWVMWVSRKWNPLTIYDKNEVWQLSCNGQKWKKLTIKLGRGE